MPPGTPYDSFALPYSIRVDEFTQLPPDYPITPTLHLLTHTHSDHVIGLSSKSFGYRVVCSPDAKEMLLRHEVYAERYLYQQEIRSEKQRTFAHLKIDPLKQPDGQTYYTGSRDLLIAVPLNTPTKFELSANETVTITLFDANHCPGAVMFLIEGSQGSVLHTGDLRVEPWFLESLTNNPYLRPYIADCANPGMKTTLDTIFLDTACIWSTLTPPTKRSAASGLIELMQMFAPTTYFFLNVWTWGYEDILTAVARSFGSQIHVDRYKYSILTHISDSNLSTIVTGNAECTRFHACERFDRCGCISNQGSNAVYVNPVTMGSLAWDAYLTEMKRKLKEGRAVTTLLVPIWRHSPLSELQSFVGLFRPHRVIPNTLDPALRGLDWRCIDEMFKGYLSSEGMAIVTALQEEVSSRMRGASSIEAVELVTISDEDDVELKNLEGGKDAQDAAGLWTVPDSEWTKLQMMRNYLAVPLRDGVDRLLKHVGNGEEAIRVANERDLERVQRWTTTGEYSHKEWSDEDSNRDDDERGLTAHKLFAPNIEAEALHILSQALSDDLAKSTNSTSIKCLLPTPATSPLRTLQSSTPGPPRSQCKITRLPSPSGAGSSLFGVHNPIILPKEGFGLLSGALPIKEHTSKGSPETVNTESCGSLSTMSKPPQKRAPARPSTSSGRSAKRKCLDSPLITSTRTSAAVPVSPQTVVKRQQRKEAKAERIKIAERLSRARPDLVTPSYAAKSNQKTSCS